MSTLIPEQRVNKLGHTVTKHVLADQPLPTRSGLILPPPSISSSTKSKTTLVAPAPIRELKLRDSFQLDSLGAERDLEDAAYIRKKLIPDAERHKKYSDAYASAKVLIVKTWQEARLPHPRYADIRPAEYPWSESARDLFFDGGTSGNLKLEHVKPVHHLITNVLFPAVEDPELTDEDFLDLLIQEHSRLSFTVLTDAEDSKLNKGKLRHRHVESEDGWARYKEAKLDISTFMALVDDERFNKETMIGTGQRGRLKVVAPEL